MSSRPLLIFAFAILFIEPVPGLAQEIDQPSDSEELLLIWEILITNEDSDDLEVTLFNYETSTSVGTELVGENESIELSFDGNQGDLEGDANTLYTITLENERFSDTFLYMLCDNTTIDLSTHGFFCPNDEGTSQADFEMFWTGVTTRVEPALGLDPGTGHSQNIRHSEYFSDDDWIMPYNLDTFCANNPTSCNPGTTSWFLALQISSDTFTFTNADLTQPSDRTWDFRDVSLKFPASRWLTLQKGLTVRDAMLSFEDNARLVYDGDYDAFDIEDGTVFKFGDGVRFNVESKITLAGTSTTPITFEPLSVGDQWEFLDLKADGNDFDWVIFDGGEKTVEVRSDNNTFDDVTFKNGWRGISSYYSSVGGGSSNSSFTLTNSTITDNSSVGVIAYHTDLTMDDTDVVDSGQAGIWITSATVSPFTDNLVENNALTSSTRSGVEVNSGGVMDSGESAFSVIKNNTFHEVSSSSSGQIDLGVYSGGTTGGYNDIYDKGTQETGEKYIAEGASYDAVAENNCWDTTSTPPASLFSGTVDYDPFISCSRASKGAAKSGGESIHERIQRAQNFVVQSAPDYRARDIARLYTIQQFDGSDQLGLLAESLELIRSVSLSTPPKSYPERMSAKERAMLTEILHAMTTEDYDAARTLISEYEKQIDIASNIIELLFSKLFLSEQANDYAGAMSILMSIRNRSTERDGLEPTLSIIEETLLDRIEDGTGRRPAPSQFASKQDDAGLRRDRPAEADSELMSVYPNPFNPSTSVTFDLPDMSDVSLVVFDVLGRRVSVLASGIYDAGFHRAEFKANGIPSGIYVVRLQLKPVDGDMHSVTVSKPILLHK